MMNSVDGSKSVGTSDADGRRRWPRCSKYDRNVSRISSEVISDDCRASDHDVPAQQDGGLARRGPVDRLAEMGDRSLEGARQGLRAVPQPDRVDLLGGPMQPDVAQRDVGGRKLGPGARDDRVR